MHHKPVHSSNSPPPNKDIALEQLGVTSTRRRKALAGKVEFVEVRAGRQLLTKGKRAPTMVVGVAGAGLITGTGEKAVCVKAPYVVDNWATNHRRIAEVTVVTESKSTLLLIDWRYRDSVFSGVPALAKLSMQTQAATISNTPVTAQVIDLTDSSSQRQPIDQHEERRNHVST